MARIAMVAARVSSFWRGMDGLLRFGGDKTSHQRREVDLQQ